MKNELNVLYQDNDIVVAYKPYGVLSEEDEKKPAMPALLKAGSGCEDIYVVHRLDRTTQGLMVYARTAEAARCLSAMMQRGEVGKIYLAVVGGVPDEPSGEMTDLLYFDRKKNKSYVVKRNRKGVKEAYLRYETLKTATIGDHTVSLVKIRLLTGRTHQIRVQFASRKTPLVGDRRYGSGIPADHIMLCSAELCFIHPFTGEDMRFTYDPTDEYFGSF